jgi:hypothetical protein
MYHKNKQITDTQKKKSCSQRTVTTTLVDIYLHTVDFGEIIMSSLTTYQTEFRIK